MPKETKVMSGFAALADLPKRGDRSREFNELSALRTVRILATPPDNKLTVRFLSPDFSLVRVHRWVKIEGRESRQNILCKKSFDRFADCPLCDVNIPFANRGITLVGILDDKDEIVYRDIDTAKASDYATYAEVMDEKNITKHGDLLTLSKIPDVSILEMGANFWRQMATYSEKYDTICDRPYTIFRNGAGLDTTYMIAPSDKDDSYRTPELLQMSFEPGLDFCMSVDEYLEFLSRPSLYSNFETDKPEPKADEPSLHDMLK